MDQRVFINYRGEDSRSYAALLHLELSRHLGAGRVFLDSESIPAGADYVNELLRQVRQSTTLLAVIGPRWLAAADSASRRRIDDPADWIRRELAEALDSGVTVIPVLTDEATLPQKADLPADIAALSRCQYRRLRHRDASTDVARIVADLATDDPTLARDSRRFEPRSLPGSPYAPCPVGPAGRTRLAHVRAWSSRRPAAILALVALVASAMVGVTYLIDRTLIVNSSSPSADPTMTDPTGHAGTVRTSVGKPVITLAPDHGSPTDPFSVHGTKWVDTASCGGQVNIYVDDRILSHHPGLPRADGTFVIDFYPDDASPSNGTLSAGPHMVTARCSNYESPAVRYTVDS